MRTLERDLVAAAAAGAIAALLVLTTTESPLPLLLRPHSHVPSVVAATPEIASRHLDRAAVAAQSVAPPDLVTEILWPTLGAPARLDEKTELQVILARPHPEASLVLVPRAALGAVEQHLYALPPLPDGSALLENRLERASRPATESGAARFLPASERAALAALGANPEFRAAWTRVLGKVAADTGDDARAATGRARSAVAEVVRSNPSSLVPVPWSTRCEPTAVGTTCIARAHVPPSLAPGQYALALVEQGRLVDVQLNATYRPRPPKSTGDLRPFVVAADLQWGDNPAVAGTVLKFISHLNSLVGTDLEPDFVLLAGDVVDCSFGSAGTFKAKLLGGADDYPRDYLQAWLALAALRVPIYMVPGNHDGYRFDDSLGRLRSDGLLLFESTFGPTYHSFDVAGWRFIMLNSYDLPDDLRTARRSEHSNVFETFSDKLNVLNWGGGIRRPQLEWLRSRLSDGPRADLRPVLVMHHDPRGTHPVLPPDRARAPLWGLRRHVPLTARAGTTPPVELVPTPRSSETTEIHGGHFTPLRASTSAVRFTAWFELGLGASLPPGTGYPGWSRYQQDWHLDALYGDDWSKLAPLDPKLLLAPPMEVLGTLVDGGVRAIFKGHDNRFARATMATGESVLGSHAEAELIELGLDRAALEKLHVKAPLSVFHVADVADFETDGHGFFWVAPAGGA